jgi:hypothetical protein
MILLQALQHILSSRWYSEVCGFWEVGAFSKTASPSLESRAIVFVTGL